ncbi:phage tail tape measure protein [Pseudomonas sp. JL972]|uniref:phage tail tape measure protein n=1 Tax=Stutzerimonas degradans TaxID=2968968 RepID=UPI0012D9AF76|nr:phage tail tape measure protein [Stutzerimonas degradans]MTZ12794.1 phage tail tape measure protein [Stutzerimonas degradans]
MARDLNLKVNLQALDNASRTFRNIAGGAVGLGRALKDTRGELKGLQALQKDVSSFRNLKGAADQTGGALRANRERVKALSRELASTATPTKALTREFQSAVRQGHALKQKHNEQQRELQGLRGKLGEAGISTRNLSDHERELRQRIERTNQTLGLQESRLKSLTAQQKRLGQAKAEYERSQQLASSMAATGAGALGAGAAAGAPVLAVISSYSTFEDAMLGVAKQVEGARDESGQLTDVYYEMGAAIKSLGERIPMATTEIAALVEGGARMGIQGKENLLAFAEVAANAATAFELPADQIGENLARIANLYKMPIQNIGELGDAINYLDDNAQSKGGDIIDVMQRTAGITASVGMSFRDAAALGSTFLSLGASAEVAGTATNAMIRELAIAGEQPKRFQKGLKALGLESEAVQRGMATNATDTIQSVLKAINALPKDEQLTVTTQLFGKEFGDDAAKLASNMGELQRQIDLANADGSKGTMQREADIRSDALSARMQMTQNRMFGLSATLGQTLRPALIELGEGFNRVLGRVTAWAEANPELVFSLLKLTGGIAALAAGFGTITLAMASILGPFAMLRYGMTVLGIKGGGLATTLFNLGKTALPLVATGLRLVATAAMANPVGALVGALAVGAMLIYANWSRVGPFFLGLWSEIKQGVAGGLAGIGALLLNFSPLGFLYRAFAGVMGWFGVELPSKFSEFGANLIQGLINGFTSMFPNLTAAIGSAADSVIGTFKNLLGIHSPSRVFAELGGHTMDGLAVGLEQGQGNPFAALTNIGQGLAEIGTNVLADVPLDSRSPLAARAPAAAAGGGNTYNVNINAAPGMDPAAIARMVRAELERLEHEKGARARSSLFDQD